MLLAPDFGLGDWGTAKKQQAFAGTVGATIAELEEVGKQKREGKEEMRRKKRAALPAAEGVGFDPSSDSSELDSS